MGISCIIRATFGCLLLGRSDLERTCIYNRLLPVTLEGARVSVPNIWQMAPLSAEILLCALMSNALLEVTYALWLCGIVCVLSRRD